jgi:hypothetical protein
MEKYKMSNNKLKTAAALTPRPLKGGTTEKFKLYNAEKELLRKEFESYGTNLDWNDPTVSKKLHEFARQVIQVTNTYVNTPGLVETLLPGETVMPGDDLVSYELSGINVYEGTYGASVRMSRPQFTKYTATPNLKEVGLKLQLAQIRTGKYSASELADYTVNVITAWRNHMFFTTTLIGSTVYQSGGAQYLAGTALAFPTMDAAYAKLSDDADARVIVARRNGIHHISNMSGWSDTAKDEFKDLGQVGSYGGTPIVKVNSFTDPDYGTVYPFGTGDIFIFSELPAGRVVFADRLRSSEETIMRNETMNIYFRFDDGIGIWHTDRIVRIAAVT